MKRLLLTLAVLAVGTLGGFLGQVAWASRTSGGTYSLPNTGSVPNPVTVGNNVTAAWANGTMPDIATALTDSLSRSGKGGMTAVLKLPDGTVSAPAVTFTSDPDNGMYRIGANELGFAAGGTKFLSSTASLVTAPLSVSSTVSTGTNAFAVATNGGRIDFGAGANDYASSDGSTISFFDDIQIQNTGSLTLGQGAILFLGSGGIKTCGSARPSIDFGTITNGQCSDSSTTTVATAVAGSLCMVGPPSTLPAGWLPSCVVTADATALVRLCNFTGGNADPGAASTYQVLACSNH